MRGSLGAVPRFGVGLVAGLVISGVGNVLIAFPLASRLDLWCVLNLASGLLLGPAGIFGSAVAHFTTTASDMSDLVRASINTGAYSLVGAIAYAVFRLVPKLERDLIDLRSYLGFVGAGFLGSLVLAGIGSANIFLRTMGGGAFWAGVVYWFSSAFTSLIIIAPLILVAVSWRLRPWMIALPGDRRRVGAAGTDPTPGVSDSRRQKRRSIAIGIALVLGTTAVVSPLVHLRPQNGGWFALLYLVPILWGSTRRGLRGGVLFASASGVAFLVGSVVSSTILPRNMSHEEILGQFVGLVIFSLVGAITGAFQQARLRAESALLQSKLELEKRHESLALANRLADRLQQTLDVETILGESVEAFVRLSRPPMVAAYLLDDEGTSLELKAQHGFDGELLAAGRTLSVQDSLSGIAVSKRQPFVCEDVSSDQRLSPVVRPRLIQAGVQSVVSIPLVFEQQALGAINLVYSTATTVMPEDLESLVAIGRNVALALVNARHVNRLEHLAFHDALTGLPNREGLHRWFSDRRQSESDDLGKMGLILIDIDRFKEVNDALGHYVGDRLLAQIGPRIESMFVERSSAVFRMAGDEFAVFLPNLADDIEGEAVTRSLLSLLAAPFEVSGMSLAIEASAGMAVFPDDGSNSSELLRCADVAVNHAKRASQRVVRYSPSLDYHTPERLALASDLGRAIRDNQLVLHFQPKVTLVDGLATGFEALVRWRHPTLGLLPPDRFIPLAEVGDLIHQLTYWVVENALEQLAEWQKYRPDLTMAVNLSTRNLLDSFCAQRLEEIIEGAQINPGTVEFELTETALLVDLEAAFTTLNKISESGARVVIDDFGTGYSSMAFLKKYPIHALKIDRSFVSDMCNDVQSRAIVGATVQLANDLGLAVVAEGIEDAATVDALSNIGCEMGQGFFFQPPVPAEELDLHLSNLY